MAILRGLIRAVLRHARGEPGGLLVGPRPVAMR
jgi:hypothetical protein